MTVWTITQSQASEKNFLISPAFIVQRVILLLKRNIAFGQGIAYSCIDFCYQLLQCVPSFLTGKSDSVSDVYNQHIWPSWQTITYMRAKGDIPSLRFSLVRAICSGSLACPSNAWRWVRPLKNVYPKISTVMRCTDGTKSALNETGIAQSGQI